MNWEQAVEKIRELMHDAEHRRDWDDYHAWSWDMLKILEDPDACSKTYIIG